MKIQKGLVRYGDRSDIECLYGEIDENTSYYFLDSTGKALTNGNIVASPELIEAIDPTKEASHVGLIDPQGNIVIPFVNKSIKNINDNIILVEKVPTTQSVIDARALKDDTAAATSLVSIAATIKANLNALTGGTGEYIFNDMFSEASIYDINGNDLLNGESYSFITMTNDKIYLSKNTAESQIFELPIQNTSSVSNEVMTTNNEVVDANNASNEAIDVNNVNVDAQQIEGALAGSSDVQGNNIVSENVVAGDSPVASLGDDNVQTAGEVANGEPVYDVNNMSAESMASADGQDVNDGAIQVTDSLANSEVDDQPSVDVTDDSQSIEDGAVTDAPDDSIVIGNENIDNTVQAQDESSVADDSNSEEAATSLEGENNTEVKDSAEQNIVDDVQEESVEAPIDASEDAPTEGVGAEETLDVPVEDEASKDESMDSSDDVEAQEIGEDVKIQEEPDTIGENTSEDIVDKNDESDNVSEEASDDAKEEEVKLNIDDSSNTSEKEIDSNDVSSDSLVDDVVNNNPLAEDTNSGEDQLISDNKYDDVFNRDMNDDLFKDSLVRTDSITTSVSSDYNDSFDYDMDNNGSMIAEDIKNAMNKLFSKIKRQQMMISKLENQNRQLEGQKRQLESQNRQYIEKSRSLEETANKQRAKIQYLEAQNYDMIRKLNSLKRSNEMYKSQLSGLTELVNLTSNMESNYSSYDYEDDTSQFRMAA